MRKTIYDIAKEAGLSASTVSRYLNNIKVSDQAKEKLDKVLANSDFRLNQIARGLTLKQTKTIGIMTVDIRVPHYSEVTYTFEQCFSAKGYNVIICSTSGSITKSIDYIKKLMSLQVDGIAFVGSVFNELNGKEEVLSLLKDTPIVIANGFINLDNAISVLFDDFEGSALAVKYMYNKKRTRICFINDMHTKSAMLKEDGYKKTMLELGLKEVDIFTPNSIDSGEKIVSEIYKDHLLYDGIICADDVVAVGLINALMEKGVKVGHDVDVIAFNNTIYGKMTLPKLTCIDNDAVLQGKLLAEKLENMINNKEETSYMIEPKLIIRGSA